MNYIVRLTFFLLFILAAGSASAQPQQAEFAHLTPRDGLSDAFVWPVLQSSDGYMWFGTMAGLDRYDGYTVRRYLHDSADETSIPDGTVHSLLERSDGSLWVGTATGLSLMDPHSGTFRRVALAAGVPADSQWVLQSFALHRSADGTVWVGTPSGLFFFPEFEPDRISRFRHDPDDGRTIGASRIHVIVSDVRGGLWIGSQDDGLTRFDPRTGVATHFRHDPAAPRSLPNNWIWDLHFDRNGQLWIGTSGAGLCRFEPHDEAFECYRHDPSDPGSLSHNGVQSIFEDEGGRLWIGTDGGGVSILDRETDTFTSYRNDPANPASLAEDDVHKVYRDRFGTMWFAHHNRGMSRMSPGSVRFTTQRAVPEAPPNAPVNLVNDLLEDGGGVLWIATAHGLIREHPATGSREHFVPFPELEPRGTVPGNRNMLGSLLLDREGRIWTGNPMGDLLVFDPRQRSFRLVPVPEIDYWAYPARWIYPWELDDAGNVWIGAIGAGLWRVDPSTDTVDQYPAGLEPDGSPIGGVALPFLGNDGTLWRAGYVGQEMSRPRFQRWDAPTETFADVTLSLPDRVQFNRMFMVGGDFWFPSSSGLFRVDPATGSTTEYPRSTHDTPVGVNGWEPDDHGRLWFGTWTGGFGYFDPEEGITVSFYAQDGIQLTRIMASRRLASGDLVFTGFGGYIRFRPDEVLSGGTAPAVQISAMHAAGETLNLSEGAPAPRLSRDQNTVAFDFVALHFADPTRNQYRYMLEGFDSGWNRAGAQRNALYPRLPPGRFTFRVQAASSSGVWNEDGASIAFTVLPPWWRTWWAYGFYGLILITGVVGVDRIQRRRVVQQERERTRERELEHAREIEAAYESLKAAQAQLVQQEKLASLGALTAGIAHEIKNPLNFVNNFGRLSGELIVELREALRAQPDALAAVDDLLDDLETNTSKIEEHGKRADAIVKSMLEHSRGGSREREAIDLNALVDEYVGLAYHGKRAQNPDFNVHLTKELERGLPPLQAVPQDLGRVVLNLLGNAFDAVSERAAGEGAEFDPAVKISTRLAEGHVELRVEDNGPGIPEGVRERIFDPFFTTKAAGAGTGLGLSLSHEIVTQGHGGTIRVESEPGRGSAFVVELPAS